MYLSTDLEIRGRAPLDALLAALGDRDADDGAMTNVRIDAADVAALARLGVEIEVVVYRPDRMRRARLPRIRQASAARGEPDTRLARAASVS